MYTNRSKSIKEIKNRVNRISHYSCLFVFGCMLVFSSFVHAQLPNWNKHIGGVGLDDVSNIKVMTTNGVLLGGSFSNTIDMDFGPGILNKTVVGVSDIFVQRTDSSGNLVWVYTVGGTQTDKVIDVAFDENGDVYATGNFTTTVDFDNGAGVENRTATGLSDIFLVKLSSSGVFQWVKTFGGSGYDTGSGIDFDSSGNVYVTGNFKGTVDFDPSGTGNTITSNGLGDIFVQKLDNSGNHIWTKTFGGTNEESIRGIELTPGNEILLTGYFKSTSVDFNPNSGVNSSFSNGSNDLYVLKWDTNGNYLWHYAKGGTNEDYGYSISVAENGDFFVAGAFVSNSIDFGPVSTGNSYILGTGVTNLYFLKFNSLNQLMWVKSLHSDASIYPNQILNKDNRLYMAGVFSGQPDFDPGPATITALPNTTNFLLKMDTIGHVLWSGFLGGGVGASQGSIAVDSLNNIYTLGHFQTFLSTGYNQTSTTISSAGSYDISMIKLSYDPCLNYSIDIDSVQNVTCGTQGSIAAKSLNGSYPISYSWTHDNLITDSVIQVNTAGTYCIYGIDANNCTDSSKIIISGANSQNQFDLESEIVTSDFRPGFSNRIDLLSFNNACDSMNGQVKLILPQHITYQNATIPPSVISGDTLIWDLPYLHFGEYPFHSIIHVETSVSAVFGDSVFIQLLTTPVSNDANPLNNSKNYIYEVVNGFDPNDIQVYPAGVCNEHFISEDQELIYKIRFQNTGNSEAINIHILDSISTDLDVQSIHVIAASHAMITEVLPLNVIKFRFDNIHLADSASNEELSKGYVIYKIKQQTGNPTNTSIQNTGAIYFDYNPPVITNTVDNTILECTDYTLSLNVNSVEFCLSDSLVVTDVNQFGCNMYQFGVEDTISISQNEYTWNPSASGLYVLSISKNNGLCSVDTLIQLTVFAPDIDSTEMQICSGDSILLEGHFVSTDGFYMDTFTNIHGCDSTRITKLIVNLNPQVSIDPFSQDTICLQAGQVNLPAGTPTGGYYSGPGINGAFVILDSLNPGTNYISYSFVDGNGCVDQDSVSIELLDCLGVNDLHLQSLNVFPNPSEGIIQITGDISLIQQVQVLDTQGRLLQVLSVDLNDSIELDFKDCKGAFILNIMLTNGRISKVVTVN